MAKTNWQDPKTSEMRSTHVAGLMEAVGKIEDSIGMETVAETNIPLTEVFISSDDRYRIFQAPEGKRNWTAEQPPVVKRNGVVISSGFEFDYGGGAIILNVNDIVANTYTADVRYIVKETSNIKGQINSLVVQEKYELALLNNLVPYGYPCIYRKDKMGNVKVHFRIEKSDKTALSSGITNIANLPAGFRPVGTVATNLVTYNAGAGTIDTNAALMVASNGNISLNITSTSVFIVAGSITFCAEN